jgi:SnoaL-like domain
VLRGFVELPRGKSECMPGDLAVVEAWLEAVNRVDRPTVLALSAPDIEIVGPRGTGRGHDVLADWLTRAGFTSAALRWFCGGDGRVVVEQDAAWSTPGGAQGRAVVASAFLVREQRVCRFQRFGSVEDALAAAALGAADEVRERQGSLS